MTDATNTSIPELEFQIRSTDGRRSNQDLLNEIRDRQNEILQAIKDNAQDAEVQSLAITREKRFGTGLAEVIIVAFLIGAAKGAGKVTGEKAAEAIFAWVHEELSDVDIIQLNLSAPEKPAQAPPEKPESDDSKPE
jgi:hypothetical protein